MVAKKLPDDVSLAELNVKALALANVIINIARVSLTAAMMQLCGKSYRNKCKGISFRKCIESKSTSE